jgi:peptidyl-prolyl cis-trans isomerase C
MGKSRIFTVSVSVFLALLIIIAGCAKKDPVLVRIDGKAKITLSEFEQSFSKGKKPEDLARAGEDAYMDHLGGLIDDRMKIILAYEKGYDQDSTVQEMVSNIRQNILLRKLHEKEIIGRVIPEKDLKDAYARQDKEFVVSHIYFRLSPRAKPEQEQPVKEKAEQVLNRIREGEDFTKLAKQFSDDKESGDRGGLLGSITWSRSNDPLQNAVFSMDPGEVSDLVRTNTGYHIIRVEEIRKRERKPFEEARGQIAQVFQMERRKQITDSTNAYQKRILEEIDPQWEEQALDSMATLFARFGRGKRDQVVDSLETLPPETRSMVLLNHSGGRVTVEDLMNRIRRVSSRYEIKLESVEALRGYIQYFKQLDFLVKRAEELDMDRERDVEDEIRAGLESSMVKTMVKKEIHDRIDPSEEDVLAYFKSHREKYSDKENVRVQEVFVKDSTLAAKICQWARRGRNFDSLAEQYTERAGYKSRKGMLGMITPGRWGIIGKKAFTMEKGQISDPLSHGEGKGYSVLKVIDKQPRFYHPYEKVQADVRSHYIRDMMPVREKEWLEQERKDIKVEIRQNVLSKAFQNEKG